MLEQNFSKLYKITHLSRNAQSPLEQIVRSEAKISTVSLGADRSERSEDKKGEKNFGMFKFERTTSKLNFTKNYQLG